jgi:hypothetical protein
MLVSGTRCSEILAIIVSAVHSFSFSSAGILMHVIVSVMYNLTQTVICEAVRFFFWFTRFIILLLAPNLSPLCV